MNERFRLRKSVVYSHLDSVMMMMINSNKLATTDKMMVMIKFRSVGCSVVDALLEKNIMHFIHG